MTLMFLIAAVEAYCISIVSERIWHNTNTPTANRLFSVVSFLLGIIYFHFLT